MSDLPKSYDPHYYAQIKSTVEEAFRQVQQAMNIIRQQEDSPATLKRTLDLLDLQIDQIDVHTVLMDVVFKESAETIDKLRAEQAEQRIAAYAQGWDDRLAFMLLSLAEPQTDVIRWLIEGLEANDPVISRRMVEQIVEWFKRSRPEMKQ